METNKLHRGRLIDHVQLVVRDLEVSRPTEVHCLCGDGTDVVELEDVADYIEETKRNVARIEDRIEIGRRHRVPFGLRRPPDGPEHGREIVFTGEIRAGHTVPFGEVFKVMETFVDVGVFDVEFNSTLIPSDELRAARRLPYPKGGDGFLCPPPRDD